MGRVQFGAAAATQVALGALTGGAGGALSAGVHVALADRSAVSVAPSRPLSERRSFDGRADHPPLLGDGNESGAGAVGARVSVNLSADDELHRLIGLGAVEDVRRKSMRLTHGAGGEQQL